MQSRSFLFGLTVLLVAGCYAKHDETDALKAAARIHSQLQQGDFAGIYRESGQSFKHEGDESRFVGVMGQFQKETGALRKITPIAYQSGVDSSAGRNYIL